MSNLNINKPKNIQFLKYLKNMLTIYYLKILQTEIILFTYLILLYKL